MLCGKVACVWKNPEAVNNTLFELEWTTPVSLFDAPGVLSQIIVLNFISFFYTPESNCNAFSPKRHYHCGLVYASACVEQSTSVLEAAPLLISHIVAPCWNPPSRLCIKTFSIFQRTLHGDMVWCSEWFGSECKMR